MHHRAWWIGGLWILLGCGVGEVTSDGSGSSSSGELRMRVVPGAITRLEWNGVDLFGGTGGYYVIGSCTGADDPNNNVVSSPSDGRTMHAPGSCPGAPFEMRVTGNNPIRVSITVGPLPADYQTLSVPMDLDKGKFDRFAFNGSGYEVGCAGTWSQRSGSGGTYASIPQPCVIPGHGNVGAARVVGVPAGRTGEATGPFATVRRTYLGGNARELIFYNHPYTNNVELGFPQGLRRGTQVSFEDEITVSDPGASPPAPSTCDPRAQPFPDWGVKNGQCLRSCGQLGGNWCEGGASCPSGTTVAGASYDCNVCCKSGGTTSGACDPRTQPFPGWGVKDGQCLRSCGQLGGNWCEGGSSCPSGTTVAGASYDCNVCCKSGGTSSGACDPRTQPFPDWGVKDGQCLRSCGQLGGTWCEGGTRCPSGLSVAGLSYDCPVCCG